MPLLYPRSSRAPVTGRPAARRPIAAGDRSGTAVLQTIIVMQVLLIVSLGVMEFGQFLYIRHAFGAAARDAARQAGLQSATNAGVQATAAAVLGQANVTMDPSWYAVYDVSSDGTTATPVTDLTGIPTGDRVRVTISTTYDQIPNAFRPLYQLFGKGIGTGKPIAGTCTMCRE